MSKENLQSGHDDAVSRNMLRHQARYRRIAWLTRAAFAVVVMVGCGLWGLYRG